MLVYFINHSGRYADEYVIYALDEQDKPKLLKIFPKLKQISEDEAFYYGWTMPLQNFIQGGFVSTRNWQALIDKTKEEIIREAINATYIMLLKERLNSGIKSRRQFGSEPIDLFV